jgi:hypothetical protein
MSFGQDVRVSILSYRAMNLWMLGYPEAALADSDRALADAREIGQVATLMYALGHAPFTYFECGNYAKARTVINELTALADEKGALFWTAYGMMNQGWLFALTGKAADLFTRSPPASPHGGQRAQACGYRCTYHVSREPTQRSANSMMLGAALAKR